MAKVYNTIGALTAVKTHLHLNRVDHFNSINELLEFQRNYSSSKLEIISKHERLIEQEKELLQAEIVDLEKSIDTTKLVIGEQLALELLQLKQKQEALIVPELNLIKNLINYVKRLIVERKIRHLELDVDKTIASAIRSSDVILTRKRLRYHYILSNSYHAVDQSAVVEVQELERQKRVIEEINPSIYGAIGEQKVSNDLEKLPEEYTLFNDFSYTFNPPIFNAQTRDRIKSIQIDHLLVAPSGIFLIETKNWSEASIHNLSLRSPVEQIKRTNYALHRLLANELSGLLNYQHWGERKIPIKNLIVLINQKPLGEFEYVKVLTLAELRGYVQYFQPCLSLQETQTITNYLLRLRGINNY